MTAPAWRTGAESRLLPGSLARRAQLANSERSMSATSSASPLAATRPAIPSPALTSSR